MSSETTEKRPRVTRKDVAYAYLTHGVGAVESLGPSRSVLRLALKMLKEDGKNYGPLEAWCIEKFGLSVSNSGKNGKSKPVVGEKRVYKAQAYADGAPFTKTPLHCLGVKRGGRVVTSFGQDKIVIERA